MNNISGIELDDIEYIGFLHDNFINRHTNTWNKVMNKSVISDEWFLKIKIADIDAICDTEKKDSIIIKLSNGDTYVVFGHIIEKQLEIEYDPLEPIKLCFFLRINEKLDFKPANHLSSELIFFTTPDKFSWHYEKINSPANQIVTIFEFGNGRPIALNLNNFQKPFI